MKQAFKNKLRNLGMALIALGAIAMPISALADDYVDDLYYSPSKAQKEKKQAEEAAKAAALKAQREYEAQLARKDSLAAAYNAAHPMTGLSMSDDAYNRHGSFMVGEPIATQDSVATPMQSGDFAYTRRIERFHNGDVVSGSNDDELMDYYYTAQEESVDPTVVNIYVNNGYPYSSWAYPYNTWGWPYGWNSWYGRPWGWSMSWNFGWYDPWYDPWYSYGWGPSWQWGFGWGMGPGMGPWYPNYSWGYPSRPWHPTGIPGASRPDRPGYASGGVGSSSRPGNISRPGTDRLPGTTATTTSRPGTTGNDNLRGRTKLNGGTVPVSGSTSGSRQTTHQTSTSRENPFTKQASNSGSNHTPSTSSGSRNTNNNYSPSNNSSSGRSSFGSSNRGSMGGGSFGGGSRSGGGASGGRGRR